ncbi:septum-promoting GTP-binding 1-like [Olea europaea subsp. europaea]|uniref:Septum-promoting GTP-binding 1-like n=1 Tax=Olea europaea subsp. europaea TaxID=158383 RepID=A0A8S0T6R4_OLEEU|nr:septum-promoting GTP-binding 1-like [Olea europaea subsp. europaea]
MTQLCRKMFHFNIKRRILWRVSILRWYLNSIWKRFLACWIGKSSVLYRQLSTAATTVSFSSSPLGGSAGLSSTDMASSLRCCCNPDRDSSDLVSLKISLLGDGQIGKTSFLTKYAGREKGLKEFAMTGMNQVDKTLCVKGAHISYSIWEVGGNVSTADDNIPAACKDSVAMLFMFDLTSRCTLNSVIPWFQQARQWNQVKQI